MKKFFDPSIRELIQHMQQIMQNPQTNGISIILLFGGSADSKYIQSKVEKAFDSVRLIIPPEAGLAVLKGAVIFGHDPTLIKSRILRFTYGTDVCPEFDPTIHREGKKITIQGVDRCTDCFSVILSAGTEVEIGQEKIKGYSAASCFQGGVSVKIFCSPKMEVKYTDDPGCFLLGELYVPLPINRLMGILNKSEGEAQPFIVVYIFGDTELKILAIDAVTKIPTSCTLKMKDFENEGENKENEK